MHRGSIPAWLLRLARQQPLYLMIASAVFGIFWAITLGVNLVLIGVHVVDKVR